MLVVYGWLCKARTFETYFLCYLWCVGAMMVLAMLLALDDM